MPSFLSVWVPVIVQWGCDYGVSPCMSDLLSNHWLGDKDTPANDTNESKTVNKV